MTAPQVITYHRPGGLQVRVNYTHLGRVVIAKQQMLNYQQEVA